MMYLFLDTAIRCIVGESRSSAQNDCQCRGCYEDELLHGYVSFVIERTNFFMVVSLSGLVDGRTGVCGQALLATQVMP